MISFLLAVKQPVRIFLTIVYVGCIIALSLLPPKDLPHIKLFWQADKIIHFLMYFNFSLIFNWGIKSELNYNRFYLVVPVTIGWGVLMEILQLAMHVGRSFSYLDMLANSVGVFTGLVVYFRLSRKFAS